jgi:hypothetical protein
VQSIHGQLIIHWRHAFLFVIPTKIPGSLQNLLVLGFLLRIVAGADVGDPVTGIQSTASRRTMVKWLRQLFFSSQQSQDLPSQLQQAPSSQCSRI